LLNSSTCQGIKVVHGTADSIVPIDEARQFTNTLASAGIDFAFATHSGDHIYVPSLALPFLSNHLTGTELYVAPPTLTLTSDTNGLKIGFSTQGGVSYGIDSRVTLGGFDDSWTEIGRLNGDGKTGYFHILPGNARSFWRVRAANSSP
jgi:hypothetical protein